MEQINMLVLENFLEEFECTQNFIERYTSINEKYRIGMPFLPKKKIIDWCRSINKRELKNYQKQLKQKGVISYAACWAFGQWKVFSWIAISLAVLSRKDLRQFSEAEIQQIALFFSLKNYDFVKFQFLALLNRSSETSRYWDSDEIRILTEIVQSYSEKEYNWRDITFQLFVRSGHRFFRGVNKCKEKWLNYLNPNLLRESWSMDEDLLLIRMIRELGQRWALISQKMNHARTEHMVKNRYSWFMRNWRKSQRQDDMDFMERVYASIKQKKRVIQQQARKEGDKQIYPFLKNEGDVKIEVEFQSHCFGEEDDGKIQGDQLKQDEGLPSSRVSASGQEQPVVKCEEMQIVQMERQLLVKCEQMEGVVIKQQQGYFPFFPYYPYVPVNQTGVILNQERSQFN